MHGDEADLFGKTYDQQMKATGGQSEGVDIAPNRRIAAEVVFEPVLNGVRVTARDANHRLLWGFIGSQGMLEHNYCPVAVYETLQEHLSVALVRHNLPAPEPGDPLVDAGEALAALEATVRSLRDAIKIKKVTKPAVDRARVIARLARDADRAIRLEAPTTRSQTHQSADDS